MRRTLQTLLEDQFSVRGLIEKDVAETGHRPLFVPDGRTFLLLVSADERSNSCYKTGCFDVPLSSHITRGGQTLTLPKVGVLQVLFSHVHPIRLRLQEGREVVDDLRRSPVSVTD